MQTVITFLGSSLFGNMLASLLLFGLWLHHRAGVSGPQSTSVRLIAGMEAVRTRMDLIDKAFASLRAEHDARLRAGGL